MKTGLASVPDAHRVDPSRARCWSVSAAGAWTVVVATCKEEGRLLGLLWIAHHLGRSTVDLSTPTRVREADEETVARWLATRAQAAAVLSSLRQEGGT